MYTNVPLFLISLFDAMHDGHFSFWKSKSYKGDYLCPPTNTWQRSSRTQKTDLKQVCALLDPVVLRALPASEPGTLSTVSQAFSSEVLMIDSPWWWHHSTNPCLSGHPIVQGPVAPGSLPVLQQREPCVIVCARSHSLGCHCSDHQPTKTWEASSSGKGSHLICIFNVKAS